MTNLDDIKNSIDAYFSDTSRSKQETFDGLCSLLSSLEGLTDLLETEIQNENEESQE